MARITTFEVGYCTHPGCVALRGAGLRICRFPARAYLIEAGRGRWLWDTGYANAFADATRSGLFSLYRRFTPVHFSPEQSLAGQLRAAGYKSGDIQGLILSHFHADHIAGLSEFRDVAVICSGDGWQQTRTLRGFQALTQGFIPSLIPADFETRVTFVESFAPVALPAALAPFEQAWCVPGSDGQILIVDLPGHAAGHIGAFVETDDGWALLASDAAWSPVSYREQRGPSSLANLVMADRRAYDRTLARLHQLWLADGAEIRLCHEGDL